MGKFLDEILETQQTLTGGVPSKIALILQNELNKEEGADLIAALKNAEIRPNAIVEALKNRNIQIDRGVILRWRKRNGISEKGMGYEPQRRH
jgi:hypothetical protein